MIQITVKLYNKGKEIQEKGYEPCKINVLQPIAVFEEIGEGDGYVAIDEIKTFWPDETLRREIPVYKPGTEERSKINIKAGEGVAIRLKLEDAAATERNEEAVDEIIKSRKITSDLLFGDIDF